MKLTLVRNAYTSLSTCGILTTPHGSYQTLEPPRKDGTHGFCISPGTYEVSIDYSGDFKQKMPILLAVPNRSEIRIHWGNYPKDTAGCILIGLTHSTDFVGSSKAAFAEFFPQLQTAIYSGEQVTITISEP
jgi:hypothetical protein